MLALPAILKAIKEMFSLHVNDMAEVIGKSESRKLSVVFGSVIDDSERAAIGTVAIHYTKTVTDIRHFMLEEPAKGTFNSMTKEEFKAKHDEQEALKQDVIAAVSGEPPTVKRGRGRPRKVVSTPPVEANPAE